MEMQPKKKKGKGCLIAILIFVAICIALFVIIGTSGNMSDEERKDFTDRQKAEQQYMDNLKANEIDIMQNIVIDEDDVENITFYYDKLSPVGEHESGMYLVFSKKDDVISSLRAYFQYDGKDNILFDEIVINVDGETHKIDLSPSDILDKTYDIRLNGFHERSIFTLKSDLRDMVFKMPSAKKITVRFKGTNVTNTYFDYEMTADDKAAIRNMVEAYQLIDGDFLYDFDNPPTK